MLDTERKDLEIAHSAELRPMEEIAEMMGLTRDDIELYGAKKAKISLDVIERRKDFPNAKYIVVTAITPTPLGEGKTTTSIGLGMALSRLGKNAAIALRESSLGPAFGIKGGGAGGGY